MSEYQYFEFQAIDRPLSVGEMRELRAYSTRATITPTRFVNDYAWGNFKGDPVLWMEKYFDAFLYVGNPGCRWLHASIPGSSSRPQNPKDILQGQGPFCFDLGLEEEWVRHSLVRL